jgi:protein-S-isoprenylcysteine O-methyltransferase Ste14
MAGFALGLYLFYLLTAFGLRSLRHYRRTGSTGFRGVSGRPGSLEWWGSALFVLALLLGLAGPLLQLLDIVAPLLDGVGVWVVGLVVAGVGIVSTLAAQQAMGVSWRVGVDHGESTELVTAGVFAFVRNPVFTAMIATGVGLTVLAPNPVALAAVVALVAAIEIQVRAVEEPYLLRTHGAVYRDYTARVGRFLPGIGRRPALGTQPGTTATGVAAAPGEAGQ